MRSVRCGSVTIAPPVLSVPTPASPPVAWVGYAAFAISALSLLAAVVLGMRSNGVAKRALALSERQEAGRAFDVGLHLNESVSWRRSGGDVRLLGFHVLATNPTDRPTTLVSAELHLSYSRGGAVMTLKVPPAPERSRVRLPEGTRAFDVPVALAANHAVSGWFLFAVNDALTAGSPVDRYDLVIRDVHGVIEFLQVTVFRQLLDAQTH